MKRLLRFAALSVCLLMPDISPRNIPPPMPPQPESGTPAPYVPAGCAYEPPEENYV